MHERALKFEYYCKMTSVFSSVAIVVFATSYVAFLLLAVGNTEIRAQAEANIKEVTSELGNVQTQYIIATQSITPERAAELGFIEPVSGNTTYVDTNAPALSFNSSINPNINTAR